MELKENWRNLIRPKGIKVDEESEDGKYGKYVCEPLERGFGITLGNSLRRVLLSAIRGAAVTQVRFDGVSHEFSTIPGVVEDVTEICLNLKSMPIKLNVPAPYKVEARFEGEREVKAKDLFDGVAVEAMEPEHHIATLQEGAVLGMEMTIKTGFGYLPVERSKESDAPIGTIPLDAVFTPIRKVNYRVTNARVGQLTDYDRLTMEVWTTGAVGPRDAIAIAARILKEQVQVFINFPEMEEEPVTEPEPSMAAVFTASGPEAAEVDVASRLEILYRPVDELELSQRAQNCIQQAGIRYIGELVQKTDEDLMRTRNFGRKSLKEIKELLADMGLSLGMKLENFDPSRPPK